MRGSLTTRPAGDGSGARSSSPSRLGCTPGQVALAYLKHQPFPVVPIIGTSNPGHLADALGALAVKLTQAQVDWLRDG